MCVIIILTYLKWCPCRSVCSAVLHNCAGRSWRVVTGRSEDLHEHQLLAVSTGTAAWSYSSFRAVAAEEHIHHRCTIFCVLSGVILQCSQTGEYRWQMYNTWQVVLTLQSVFSIVIIAELLRVHYYYKHFATLCPGLPRWVGMRRINHSGFCWSRHNGVAVVSAEPYASYLHFTEKITMPTTSLVRFLRAGCPSCRPTNSVNALKAHFRGKPQVVFQ